MLLLRPWCLAALAILLLAAQASAQDAASSAGAPDTATLQTIEAQVSQIRGLQQLADTPLRLLDHASLQSYLLDQFTRNYLPRERESDQKELEALGLIQPGDDLVKIQLKLLSDQVIGIYDTDSKALFVVSDQSGGFGPAARLTYAHEYNHALQDQHFDLNSLAPKHAASNDRSMAVHAMIEGDAIMLQTLWAARNLTTEDLLQLARDAAASDGSLGRVPLVMRAELLFPYTDGFNFVRQVYRQANNNYAAVDDLFLNPPESTTQILHPDKYRDRVHPADVPLADLASSLGPDWRLVGNGVLGELDTRVLLEQGTTPHTEAVRIAGNWSGDRWQVVESGAGTAIVVKSTWETPTAASDFFSAYTRGLRARFADAVVDDASSAREALATPTSVTDVRVQSGDVLIVIAPNRDIGNAIVAAVTPSAP